MVVGLGKKLSHLGQATPIAPCAVDLFRCLWSANQEVAIARRCAVALSQFIFNSVPCMVITCMASQSLRTENILSKVNMLQNSEENLEDLLS